ncbi:MAG: ATP-binding protein [Candidatus Nitrosotenuis sp.]
MSDNSPYFFIKELSSEEITKILVNKIKELRVAKQKAEELNTKLQDNMSELEETRDELARQRDQLQDSMAALEEAKQELAIQRDQLQAEIMHKTREILRSERLSAIGNLSARIAHDLRNPLSVIQSTSQILRLKMEQHLDEKTREQWARLDRAIYRMSHQLEDVMDYVRISPLKKKDYSLCTILQDVVERIVAPENIVIHLPQNDRIVFCDPEKLEIVFVNLLMNAMQALETKEGSVTIEIADDPQDGNNVLIKVIDTGAGIPDDIKDKIFEPLFTTKQTGTGLGLSSCKNIIEQHGGTLSVSSTVGRGAAFTIKMPKKSEWDNVVEHENPEQVKSA